MKGKRKKVQHFFVYIAMLVMSGFLIMGIVQKEKEKKELSSKKKELEKAKQNLTNPDYVEYIARGKYLVTKEEEQVFKFPSKD